MAMDEKADSDQLRELAASPGGGREAEVMTETTDGYAHHGRSVKFLLIGRCRLKR